MTLYDPTPAAALSAWREALHAAGFAAPLAAEEVASAEARGRVLAAPLIALRPSPAVRVAAMDGIAVRAESTTGAPVVLPSDAFIEIDTGGPMPDAFDAVVRRERVTVDTAGAHIEAAVEVGADVRPAGEDIPTDAILFHAGHVIDPVDLGLAAAAGHATLPVRRRPRVAVMPTGDEVRAVGEDVAPEHVLDSNGPMLAAQAEADGALAVVARRAGDDPVAIRAAAATLVAGADLVCVVAGSSRGRRDHTRSVLAELGELVVDGVAVRPGHPVQLAVVEGTPVIGVPGYPVSAAFTYELFVRPILGDLLGGLRVRAEVEARLAERVGGHEGAECLVGVSLARDLDGVLVATPGPRRAGALRALARADGYIRIPPGDGLPAGVTAQGRLAYSGAVATRRTKVKRLPKRGHYDRATIDAILDEAIVCHIGFTGEDGQPFVIPSLHARVGDVLYLHGSSASRALKTLAGGVPCCVTVTLVDGLVLARAVFDQSVNYRSVVVLGEAQSVDDPAEKLVALEALTEQLVPGRWADVRPPTETELKATTILALPIDEASAKVRSGPPGNDPADTETYAGVWTGVLPITTAVGEPIPAPDIAPGVDLPESLARWGDRFAR